MIRPAVALVSEREAAEYVKTMSDIAPTPTKLDKAPERPPASEPSPSIAPQLASQPALASKSVADAGNSAANEVASSASPIGVLLVNLGTPDAPTPAAIRRYLKEFLTDRRVIENEFVPLEVCAKLHHPAAAVAAQSARLPENLESRKERIAIQDHHAFAGRKARQYSRAARQACHRRLGDALRQSRRSPRGSKC